MTGGWAVAKRICDNSPEGAELAVAGHARTLRLGTGRQSHCTSALLSFLIEKLRAHPGFSSALADDSHCRLLIRAAPLRDIGKVGIPDAILRKPACAAT